MDDHHLDDQIRAALGVNASPSHLQRLEDFWHGRRRAQRRRRAIARAAAWAVALAASVLVAVVGWQWLGQNQHVAQTPPSVQSRPRQPRAAVPQAGNVVPHAAVPQVATEQAIPRTDSKSVAAVPRAAAVKLSPCSRPPTVYEQVMFLAHERRARGSKRQSKPSVDVEIAAAVKAVERIKEAQPLAQFVAGTKSAEVRAALLRRLLAGDSETAVRGYLLLVANPRTRDEAVHAATSVSGPLLARLLKLLEDKDRATRLAAAMVLGHVDGPEVANALVQKVQEQPRRSTEAWIALLACRGERVATFLAQVKYDFRYVGPLNRARAEWARMTM
jgi:hypothetical protein